MHCVFRMLRVSAVCVCEQGTVEAGNERPINISWTPPAGHEV